MKDRLSKLKTEIPAIYISLHKKDTPVIAKVIGALTVIYALSPIDLIPDFIPVLGYLDDLIILPVMAYITVKLIPDDILNACRIEAEGLWRNGKPKKWYCALPVIILWAICLCALMRAVL